MKIKDIINKLSKSQKIVFIISILILLFLIILFTRIPSLAKYIVRSVSPEISIWDGSVADAYNSGTGSEEDPYVITNGSELAYFKEQLKTDNYENKYFILNSNIMLNEGIFEYDSENEKIKYILKDQIYYLNPETGKFYSDALMSTEVGTINIFGLLDRFKGSLDGNSYTIYGLFTTGDNDVSLFTDLRGNLKNLYVENSIAYGGNLTAGIAASTYDAVLDSVLFKGFVIGENTAGGIIGTAQNTTVKNTINNSNVYGGLSGGLIGSTSGTLNINNSYNSATIEGTLTSGGLVGSIEDNSTVSIYKSYNSALVETNGGGLIGNINNPLGNVSISNSFNAYNIYSIGNINNSNVTIEDVYTIDSAVSVNQNTGTIEGNFILTSLEDLKDNDFVADNLLFAEFVNNDDLEVNLENVWIYKTNDLPILYIEDAVVSRYKTNSLIIGRNFSSYEGELPYITNKSAVTLNFSFTDFYSLDFINYHHAIVSSIPFPIDSKLVLVDNINKKNYEYKVTSNINVIKFELFKEIGSNNKNFAENIYYNNGIVNENFSIILDLSDTDFSDNYDNIYLNMEMQDENNVTVRETLKDSIKKFHIYSVVDEKSSSASLSLTTDYNNETIEYNNDSITEININSKLIYKKINDTKIIDTLYENKTIGWAIKLVDSEGNIIEKEHLKSFKFMVDDKNYYPEKDGIVRINLENGIIDTSKKLNIISYENNDNLKDGVYYFKISNYIADDGKYYYTLENNELSIPVNVIHSNINTLYNFDVIMDEKNQVIGKNNTEVNVLFKVLQNGQFESPNIRVSLYKKDLLTAYDQEYVLVDLSSYINDTLEVFKNEVYYVSTNPVKYEEPEFLLNNFELNLKTSSFENTGYKFVFELYDANKKIGTIEKYFIVKQEVRADEEI